MKYFRYLLVIASAAALISLAACSDNQSKKAEKPAQAETAAVSSPKPEPVVNAGFTEQQKTEIGDIIHNYLIKNPDILVTMSEELQKKQMIAQQAAALKAIKANEAQIFDAKTSPVVGNVDGAVTIVEFFDYQCVHCEHMYPVVDKIMATNPNVRVVFKEFPIFGEASQYAAQIALESGKDYYEMHEALFKADDIEGKMTKDKVNQIAKSIGIDAKALAGNKEAAANAEAEIKANYQLAQKLGIRGTPAFIIAPTPGKGNVTGKTTFIPGATNEQALQQAIDAAK